MLVPSRTVASLACVLCSTAAATALLCLTPSANAAPTLVLTSAAFGNGQEIPTRYTCEGTGVSPPLSWSGAPSGTRALVLLVEDPDAPDPREPKKTASHWNLYNLPPTSSGLPEGVVSLPVGTQEGKNESGSTGYLPPCPTVGQHHYFFKLLALDEALPDLAQPNRITLESATLGHVLAQATFVGLYAKLSQQ